MKAAKIHTIRQGDVALVRVLALPDGCIPVDGQENKIVLAWGEVTGHHHRIENHVDHSARRADELASNVIARAQTKARLLIAPNGERYLEVSEAVELRHEEHSSHTIPAGIYHLPSQMEYQQAELRNVAD